MVLSAGLKEDGATNNASLAILVSTYYITEGNASIYGLSGLLQIMESVFNFVPLNLYAESRVRLP